MTIDRQALVKRYDPEITEARTAPLLQIGNGEFAFSFDATGLQSFAGTTMAQWSWHSSPFPPGMHIDDFKLKYYLDAHGREVGYPVSPAGQETLYAWLRENPHRFHLGTLRLLYQGRRILPEELSDISQKLSLWTGIVKTHFRLAGKSVDLEGCCHPERALLAFRLESELADQLAVELDFPCPDSGTSGARQKNPDRHMTSVEKKEAHQLGILRRIDGTSYHTVLKWDIGTEQRTGTHTFRLQSSGAHMEFSCEFSQNGSADDGFSYSSVWNASACSWRRFWMTGGAMDLSQSRDSRWEELERRIVLSQYLLAVNEAGSLPPQESGLYNNSGWYGKFHLEMHFWHGAHWALWNRWEKFAVSLPWYRKILPEAKKTAERQGYRGVRWPKMTGPEGRESPSGIGPFLIWQQAHPILYAELDYRLHPSADTLANWREIVFETADFMASFAAWDSDRGCFQLGPPLKTMPENNPEESTWNPAYELQAWRFGLRTALLWQKRMNLPLSREWETVLARLAPLPVMDGACVLQEGMTDCYGKWNWEHPAQTGAFGVLPPMEVDESVMKRTMERTSACWDWDRCWGWDFPMAAMGAARAGKPDMAVDLLLHPSERNRFDEAGLCHGGPYPYFPGNGGLLYAVAMMAAGWDGAPECHAPGFPEEWTVAWENLNPAL